MQKLRASALMIACALAITAAAAAQAPQAPRAPRAPQAMMGATEQQVLQADKDRFAAMIKVDDAALNKLVADDVVYTHSTAMVQSKKEFIDMLKGREVRYMSMTHVMPDVKVQILGNTALVTGTVAVHVVDHGTDKNMKIRFTEVHTNRSGSWQLLAWQSTTIPAP